MIRIVLFLGMSLVQAQNPFRPKRWSLAGVPNTDVVFKRDAAAADGADQSEYIEVTLSFPMYMISSYLDVRKDFSYVCNPCLSRILYEKLPGIPRSMRCSRSVRFLPEISINFNLRDCWYSDRNGKPNEKNGYNRILSRSI